MSGACACGPGGCKCGAAKQGLRDQVARQEAIIQALADQVSIMRGVMWAMLQQASMDEIDQTPAGNPWLALKKQAAKLINPSILALNGLLGIKAEAQPEKQKALVIATEGPAGGNIKVPSAIARV